MTSRRQFIRQTGTLAAGTFLVPGLLFKHQPEVIILGAGFAGLAAAYSLRQKGIKCTVLEARSRVGGRVHSVPMGPDNSLISELGAEWVGDSHERVKALCTEFGLKLNDNRCNSHLIYHGRYYRPGEWNNTQEAWKVKFKQLLDGMTEDEKIRTDKTDWWRYLRSIGMPEDVLTIRELFDSTDFGESIRHVSAYAALTEYAESSPNNEMDWKIKGGNSMLGKELARRTGYENIHMGEAAKVVSRKGRKVIVYTSLDKVYVADALICALPTQSIMSIKWEPALPADKLDAMAALQYARITKNVHTYSQRFWKREDFDMATDGPAHYFYHATQGQAGPAGVLTCYAIGDKADVMARQTDETKLQLVSETLQTAFGETRPLHQKQVTMPWGDDPYSKGSYALYGVGQWFGIRPVLAQPVDNIFFAGEHIADWQGFMEGAIATGEEAALAVLS